MNIYVVRHGQTDLNIQKRMQGRKGLPLNSVGISQAEASAAELCDVKFDAVYSSPQERAVQTAKIVSHGQDVLTDERLQPFDVGSADNQIIDESMKLTVGLIPDPMFYSGVEDPSKFVGRICDFMDEIIENNLKNADQREINILIAGHKCTTGAINGYFNGLPENGDFFSLSIKNGKYKIFNVDRAKSRYLKQSK